MCLICKVAKIHLNAIFVVQFSLTTLPKGITTGCWEKKKKKTITNNIHWVFGLMWATFVFIRNYRLKCVYSCHLSEKKKKLEGLFLPFSIITLQWCLTDIPKMNWRLKKLKVVVKRFNFSRDFFSSSCQAFMFRSHLRAWRARWSWSKRPSGHIFPVFVKFLFWL